MAIPTWAGYVGLAISSVLIIWSSWPTLQKTLLAGWPKSTLAVPTQSRRTSMFELMIHVEKVCNKCDVCEDHIQTLRNVFRDYIVPVNEEHEE